MFDVKRLVMAVVVGGLLATGALGQKERPVKPPNTVVVKPKGEKPPPSNNNGNQDKRNDGKKPKN